MTAPQVLTDVLAAAPGLVVAGARLRAASGFHSHGRSHFRLHGHGGGRFSLPAFLVAVVLVLGMYLYRRFRRRGPYGNGPAPPGYGPGSGYGAAPGPGTPPGYGPPYGPGPAGPGAAGTGRYGSAAADPRFNPAAAPGDRLADAPNQDPPADAPGGPAPAHPGVGDIGSTVDPGYRGPGDWDDGPADPPQSRPPRP